jgi:hypothetical protein
VVGVTRPSRRRGAVVGVLREEGVAGGGGGLLFLMPRDARLPRAVVQVTTASRPACRTWCPSTHFDGVAACLPDVIDMCCR